MTRFKLRLIGRDQKGRIDQVIEQEIPATQHEIGLALRRSHFVRAVAFAILKKGAVEFERSD